MAGGELPAHLPLRRLIGWAAAKLCTLSTNQDCLISVSSLSTNQSSPLSVVRLSSSLPVIASISLSPKYLSKIPIARWRMSC